MHCLRTLLVSEICVSNFVRTPLESRKEGERTAPRHRGLLRQSFDLDDPFFVRDQIDAVVAELDVGAEAEDETLDGSCREDVEDALVVIEGDAKVDIVRRGERKELVTAREKKRRQSSIRSERKESGRRTARGRGSLARERRPSCRLEALP